MAIPEACELLLGNGSDEIIHIMIQALARPGAVVLAPEPTFVMYRAYALVNRMRYVGVPLAPDFTLDCARMLAAIAEHQPALTFIAYPNNPSGNLFPEPLRILHFPRAGGVDEAHHAFAQKSHAAPRAAPQPHCHAHAVESGMAGLRRLPQAARPDARVRQGAPAVQRRTC
jgi:histidinol-phosphate aminotransferase